MTSNPRRAKGGGWAVIALVLVLPVLYVLSVGPVYRACAADGSSLRELVMLGRVYAPIWWVGEQWPAFEWIMVNYAGYRWPAPEPALPKT
jgi:hypothetical protein